MTETDTKKKAMEIFNIVYNVLEKRGVCIPIYSELLKKIEKSLAEGAKK